LGYPDRTAELAMLTSQQNANPLDNVRPLITIPELLEIQKAVRTVEVADRVREYILDIIRATRESPLSTLGVSPRGALHLQLGAQACALTQGRTFATPDDVKSVAALILSHRIMTRSERGSMGASQNELIAEVLRQVPAPVPTR